MKNFEKFASESFECFHLKATTYLVIAVYRPPRFNVKSFFNHFNILCAEKRLQFDRIVLPGDLYFSLNVINVASNILDSILPHKKKTFAIQECPFFNDELLSWKRKKKKAGQKYRKSKTSVLKIEYESINNMKF